MKAVLDIILPKVLPQSITFQTVKHEGEADLERSIPIKLKAFKTPDTLVRTCTVSSSRTRLITCLAARKLII